MTGPSTTTRTMDEPMVGSTEETEPTHPLVDAGQEAAASAGQLASRAADMGIQQADRGRQHAADGIEALGETIRRITSDLQVEQPAIANVADTAAEQTERVATYLREHDTREILKNIEDLARRQPVLFLGGAFVLGVAASRFIKAAGGGQSNEASRASQTPAASGWHPVSQPMSAGYDAATAGTRNGHEDS